MTVRSLAGTLVGLLATSISASLSAQSRLPAPDSLALRFGDAVRITVWRKPSTAFRDVVVPCIGIAGSIAAIITVARYRR
jgi:protein involved in polysaccharide export with SLBB domain